MEIADWLSISAVLAPFWIALGFGLGLPGFIGMKRDWRVGWTVVTAFIFGLAWWTGAKQSAHDRMADATNADTHNMVVDMARDLHLSASSDIRQMLKEIARKVLPRRVRPDQAITMAQILRPVGPQKFQVTVTSTENETIAFAQQIADALLAAGWTPPESGPIRGCIMSSSGVVISGHLMTDRPTIATALLAAIQTLGVIINDDLSMNSCAPAGVAEIFVGHP